MNPSPYPVCNHFRFEVGIVEEVLRCALALTLAVVIPLGSLAAAPVIQTDKLRVTLREDLNGVASAVDVQTGREYVPKGALLTNLYRLDFGRNPDKPTQTLVARDAVRRQVRATPNGSIEISFEHEGEIPVKVFVVANHSPNQDGIRWRIRVEEIGAEPLTRVEFPVLPVAATLGASGEDDAIAYPQMEGVLLTRPGDNIKSGSAFGHSISYLGHLSAQFLYYYDTDGGIYVAAEDSHGHPKSLILRRTRDTLALSVRHLFPSEKTASVEVPYDVLWSVAGGRWEAGAELYRQWAHGQPWCARTIAANDAPAWLKEPFVFLNVSLQVPGSNAYVTASAAAASLLQYREFFGAPIVTCLFGWERHGAFIGGVYFPPYLGESYYRELAALLKQRGDHLHVMTSGFRWGVRRPVELTKDKAARVYTDYDGRAQFEAEGKNGAVVKADGQLDFRQLPWADNYILCAGTPSARNLLLDVFRRVYSWGVAGVDLDQDIGGEASPCWSAEHGHPPGYGCWQFEAMSDFLQQVRVAGRAVNRDAFVGVEEPCEAHIPRFDIYHGRAFTDTRWPVSGPGAVSIPLYIYLYHEHQLGYAGWIDAGFSPGRNVRVGIARALLFGMQPGVRINGGPFDLLAQPPTPEMQVLRDAFHVFRRASAYLLLGRMLPAPAITGSPMTWVPGRIAPNLAAMKGRSVLPVPWPVVQATAWRSPSGTVGYAIANLCGEPQAVQLQIESNGMTTPHVRLTRIGPDGERVLMPRATCPMSLSLDLAPWEFTFIEQTSAAKETP